MRQEDFGMENMISLYAIENPNNYNHRYNHHSLTVLSFL